MLLIIPFVIPLFSFFLQTYPRFFNKYFGVDVWTRLLEIDHVKRARHKIPGKITKGFLIEGYFDYPIIFPWLFSFVPKKRLLKIQGFVSPFFDMLQNILVFFIAYQLTSNFQISIISQLIYSLIPMIPIENSYMTPRSMGYLGFTLSLMPLLFFQSTNNLLFLCLGFFFTCLLFIIHRFALQSLIFASIFLTFYDKSLLYILNLVLAFITITILTKGYYLRVAKGHFYNIYFWVKNYKFRFAHQIYGNQEEKKLDWVGKIYKLLSVFSPIFLFGINLWMLSGFVFLFLLNQPNVISLPKNPIFIKFSVLIIFFYFSGAVILKIKRLIPIGEGQRYSEMTTVPTAILSSILFFAFYTKFGFIALIIFIILCMINLILILMIQINGVIKDKNRSITKELFEAFTFINKLKGTPRIICIPHQNTTMTAYHTKADILVNADNPGLMKIQDVYPILKKNIEEIKKEYKLDYLLLRETFVPLKALKIKNPKIIFKSGDVLLIKLAK
ncbi:hypothetical protein HZA75_06765 [Candidatus Roizmanbacteria bacterium]|nr:hypothetical protein [Candidatus Roizmanbacteria bacterium]